MQPTYLHEDLKQLVSDTFQIQDLFAKSRKTDYVVARSVYFYLLREKNFTYSRLAELGNCHHSSILHSIKMFEEYYNYYYEFKSSIDYIVSEWAAVKRS